MVLPARLEPTLLRNSRIAFALLALLPPTIGLCQTRPIEWVPEGSPSAQTLIQTPTQTQAPASQSPTPDPAAPQKSLPEAPSSTIIDPNEVILHQTPRIMGVL